jgi:hypothetical protein
MAMAFVIAAASCGDGPLGPEVELAPDIRPYVVGEAEAALNGDGAFEILQDLPPGSDSPPTVTADRAAELGAAFIHSYGPAFLAQWQNERGAAINLSTLQLEPRRYAAVTPFEAVPSSTCHSAFVRLFGSFYLFRLASGQDPEILLATSAQVTDYSVDSNGDIVEPSLTGMDFLTIALPVNKQAFAPLTPEQATAIAARTFNAKVSRVPELVLRDVDFAPIAALWSVMFDRSVEVHTNGQTLQTQIVYVGPNRPSRFFVEAPQQPIAVTRPCLHADGAGTSTITVPVKAGRPIQFMSVTP